MKQNNKPLSERSVLPWESVAGINYFFCSYASLFFPRSSPQDAKVQHPQPRMLHLKRSAYVNALDLDWVGELSLAKGEKLGMISRSGVTDDFQDWEATILSEGTAVYESGESEVLLAETEAALIPYLKCAEG